MKKEIFVRYERCLGCRSCELACATAHSQSRDFLTAIWEEPAPKKRLFVDRFTAGEINIPMVCRHCTEAYCINACITGVMHRREDGIVTNLGSPQRCVGCWMCVMACPYGVIRPDNKVAIKCDRECLDETGTPACVAACPTKALVYATAEEFDRLRREDYQKQAFPQWTATPAAG